MSQLSLQIYVIYVVKALGSNGFAALSYDRRQRMTTPRLDVVLINPGSRARVYQALGARLTAVENPVWAGLIATFLRGRGLSVEIIDGGADDLAPDDVARRVGEANPRLAVVVVYGHQPSASTQHMPASGAVASAI